MSHAKIRAMTPRLSAFLNPARTDASESRRFTLLPMKPKGFYTRLCTCQSLLTWRDAHCRAPEQPCWASRSPAGTDKL